MRHYYARVGIARRSGGSCVATSVYFDDAAQLVTALPPDPRSALILNGYLDADRLIGLAQPTVWSDYGVATAQKALEAAHAALFNARYLADLTTASRLKRAIGAANDVVLAANLARTGNDHEPRVGVGMAICLRAGRAATIALNPPIQMLLFQGSNRTWYPARESWTGDDPGLSGTPLGWTSTAAPTLVTTIVDHSDEVLLTTAHVAASLARATPDPRSSSFACDQIAAAATNPDIDPIAVVAVSTRFEAPSLAGNIRSVTRHALGTFDRRARAVWNAIRTDS